MDAKHANNNQEDKILEPLYKQLEPILKEKDKIQSKIDSVLQNRQKQKEREELESRERHAKELEIERAKKWGERIEYIKSELIQTDKEVDLEFVYNLLILTIDYLTRGHYIDGREYKWYTQSLDLLEKEGNKNE